MRVNPLFNGVQNPSFERKKLFTKPKLQNDVFQPQHKTDNQNKNKKESFFKRAKTAIIATTSSLITALSVFALANIKIRNLKNDTDFLRQTNSDLTQKNIGLEQDNDELRTDNDSVRKTNESLVQANSELQAELEKIVKPEDVDARVDKLVQSLDGRQLPYSPTISPIPKKVVEDYMSYSKYGVKLPAEYVKTTNRSDAHKLNYGTFHPNQPYSFTFPVTSEVEILKEDYKFKPVPKTFTTIGIDYAKSLNWDNGKIARDLMQNFYDGHSQTLDGVKFDVTPNEDGTHKVRISGKSIYSPAKAILLGETSKKDNNKAAGSYGEGLKMVVLKLLTEKGANNVNIASNDWKVSWGIEHSDLDKDVLAYQVDKVPPIDGNYIEFDTDNVELINAIIDSFDRFYHYNNPAFRCPDFENDKMGIKFTKDGEKGNFYIAGQAFQVNGKYENLPGMNIFIKEKPPVKDEDGYIFDASRDRVSLNTETMSAIAKWAIKKDNMSKEDAIHLLHAIKPYWGIEDKSFLNGFIDGATYRLDIIIDFGNEKLVADQPFISPELKYKYIQAGYKICKPFFAALGMQKLSSIVDTSRKHMMLEPTVSEKNKILLIKDAITLLQPVLETSKLFKPEELDTKIYLFDNKSPAEDKAYNDVDAEAIIDNKKSLGFWIDKTYLQKSSFSEVLGTALHELTHKYGGDESMNFSYKLTDVLQQVFKAINDNPNLAEQLKVIEQAWNKQQ